MALRARPDGMNGGLVQGKMRDQFVQMTIEPGRLGTQSGLPDRQLLIGGRLLYVKGQERALRPGMSLAAGNDERSLAGFYHMCNDALARAIGVIDALAVQQQNIVVQGYFAPPQVEYFFKLRDGGGQGCCLE